MPLRTPILSRSAMAKNAANSRINAPTETSPFAISSQLIPLSFFIALDNISIAAATAIKLPAILVISFTDPPRRFVKADINERAVVSVTNIPPSAAIVTIPFLIWSQSNEPKFFIANERIKIAAAILVIPEVN